MSFVVLGMGSNLGDRASYLRRALRLITQEPALLHHVRVSRVYETEALLTPGSPDDWNKPYLNIAIAGETGLEPETLLRELKSIEARLGRKNRKRWAPREIDLDILVWDSLTLKTNTSQVLEIPHPALLERDFALLPLSELAPEWKYPVTGPFYQKTAQELASRFKTRQSQTFAPELVGILNITPDSFSDGGLFVDSKKACEQLERLVDAGAAVIDLGAESTRPGAAAVSADEEWRRLNTVLNSAITMTAKTSVRISVDTRHPEVAQRAIESGAHWINDVTGFEDPRMQKAVADSSVDAVVMHSLGIPPSRDQVLSEDQDPVTLLLKWADSRFCELEKLGIRRDRLIFDPGIGFGKTPRQSLEILKNTHRFAALGTRVLIGHSRKSFLSIFTDKPFAERDPETLAISLKIAQPRAAVDYLRVHNVEAHTQALKVAAELELH